MFRHTLSCQQIAVGCIFMSFVLSSFGQTPISSELDKLPAQELIRRVASAGHAERVAIVDNLISRRSETLPALRSTLTSGTIEQKALACNMLSEMRDKESVELLIDVTQSPEGRLQYVAINALREIGDSRAAPRLRDVLKGRNLDEGKKICALIALGRLGADKDLPQLRGFLNDESAAVRTAAAGAIAMLGSPEAQDVLIQMTEAKDPFTQKLAVKSLGYLDTPESTSRLEAILRDPSASWKNYARISIEQQRLRREKSTGERVRALSRLAADENTWMAEWAIEQISDMDTQEARQELRRLSKSNMRHATQARRTLSLRGDPAQ